MNNSYIENAVNHVRTNWKSLGGKLLSIGDQENDFLKAISEATSRAYLPSIRRALKGADKNLLKNAYNLSTAYMFSELHSAYLNNKSLDYYKVITKIKEFFIEIPDYSFGNAQKYVYMSVKYLLSSNKINYNHPLFIESGIPIDRATITLAKKEFNIDIKGLSPWSKCNNLDIILEFQNQLKNKVKEKYDAPPLFWECSEWVSPQSKEFKQKD